MALTDNLISYWKLGEASGTRVDSVVASGNDLTDNNTVTQAAGKLGNAAQFTAANSEYLSIADNASLSTGDIDFTTAAWVYLDTKPGSMAIAGRNNPTGNQREWLLFYNGTDVFTLQVSNDGTATTQQSATTFGIPSTATWYYVVAWHDSVNNTLNIQINNGTVDSSAYTSGVLDSTSSFIIGANGDAAGLFMDGRIDSVGFWKRVLTAAERTSLYNGGNGNEYPFSEAAVAAVVSPPILSYRHNQRTHRIPGTVNPSWPI